MSILANFWILLLSILLQSVNVLVIIHIYQWEVYLRMKLLDHSIYCEMYWFILMLFSHSVMSDSLPPHGRLHSRLPCPSKSPRTCSNSCPLSDDAIQPSHPLSSPSPPIFYLSQHQGLFQWVGSSHQVTPFWSFSISPSNEYLEFTFFRVDWFDLAVQGSLKSLLQQQFKSIDYFVLSFLYGLIHMCIRDYWEKTIALTIQTFVDKVWSLLFNTLSRFVVTFLPRSKRLLISWLQSLSVMILEPKKIKSVAVSTFSPSICHEMMGLSAMTLLFWMLNFKPGFPLSSFTLMKRLFSSSLFSAFRMVSSTYLWLLPLLANLIPACTSSSLAFHMMYSAYKLNLLGDNVQLWPTPFPIWNQSVVPHLVLTVASWPPYRFFWRQIKWSGITISLFPLFVVIIQSKAFL